MSENNGKDELPQDGGRALPREIIVDCSDWESDIPPEKWSHGQFITDPRVIAAHFKDYEADPGLPPHGVDGKKPETPPPGS